MPDPREFSTETLARMADELLGTPLAEQELQSVAALLGALTSEMAPMRAMDVGNSEPATIDKASRP